MTHPTEAVEAVARALAESYFDGRRNELDPLDKYDWKSRDDAHKAGWKLDAHAIIDAITPILTAAAEARERQAVEAEREACAVICDKAATAYQELLADNCAIVGDELAGMGRMGADACRTRAAAIRARGKP